MLRDNIKERARVVLRELHRLFPNPKIALVYSSVWELVVAVSLSAQCTDKKVNEVTQKLFKKYTSIQEYADADITELEQDIKSTGFYRNKAKNVNAAAKTLIDDFDGTVPQTMKELITLAGVGRKTANVVLAEGFGIVEGIAVDTHVKRLSNKFGLTKNTDPLKNRKRFNGVISKRGMA